MNQHEPPPTPMRQRLHRLEVATRGRGLVEITAPVLRWTRAQGIGTGLLTLWCRHTSASLLVNENASPAVRDDLEAFFARLVPDGDVPDPGGPSAGAGAGGGANAGAGGTGVPGGGRYRHDEEGPDDMPAHLRTALTQVQLSIPVDGGQPVLGTWQGLFLFEHRHRPHRREIVLHLLGEAG